MRPRLATAVFPPHWRAGKQSFRLEPGHLSIMLGVSSAGVRLEKRIEVKEK